MNHIDMISQHILSWNGPHKNQQVQLLSEWPVYYHPDLYELVYTF